MEEKVEYLDYVYKRPRGKRFRARKFSFFMFAIALSVCMLGFFVANMFFGWVNLKPYLTVGVGGTTHYALVMDVFADKNSAERYAIEKKPLGAAGYILHTSDGYSVVASIYSTKEDAQKVAEQTSAQLPNCKVVSLTAVSKLISLEEKEHKEFITEVSQTFLKAYHMLYTASVQLDKGELTKEEVQAQTIILQNNINTLYDDAIQLNAAYSNGVYAKLNSSINKQMVELYNLCYGSNFVYGFSSEVKNTYCTILQLYIDFVKVI